eukprot:scaffold36624_cov62-Phaeocystis_antarctica.AAC.4
MSRALTSPPWAPSRATSTRSRPTRRVDPLLLGDRKAFRAELVAHHLDDLGARERGVFHVILELPTRGLAIIAVQIVLGAVEGIRPEALDDLVDAGVHVQALLALLALLVKQGALVPQSVADVAIHGHTPPALGGRPPVEVVQAQGQRQQGQRRPEFLLPLTHVRGEPLRLRADHVLLGRCIPWAQVIGRFPDECVRGVVVAKQVRALGAVRQHDAARHVRPQRVARAADGVPGATTGPSRRATHRGTRHAATALPS